MTSAPVLIDQESEPRGALAVHGTVLGPDGRGIGSARVVLDSVPARATVTDARGSFSFDGLIPRSYVVSARSDDAWGMTAVRLTRAAQFATLQLQPGATMVVRVLDSIHGTPIGGARVAFGDMSAMTSGQGDALLRPIPPGWADLEISAPGYATIRKVTIVSAAPGQVVAVRMSAGFSIAGAVVDEHGSPVAGVALHMIDETSAMLAAGRAPARTDEHGRFLLTDIAAGVRRIVAVDADHAVTTSRPLVVGHDLADLTLTLKKGGRLDGRVLDAAGAPVANAVIHIDASDGSYSRRTVSGADGRFTLVGLGRALAYVRAQAALGATEVTGVDLERSTTQSIELRLMRAGVIGGTVVDYGGRPCPGVRVNAVFRGNSSVFDSVAADQDGRFLLGDLPEGEYQLWTGRFSEQHFGLDEVFARTGDRDFLVTRPTFGSIRGEVGLAGSRDPPRDVLVGITGRTIDVDEFYRAVDTGTFVFERVPPGEYDLRLRGPEFVDTQIAIEVAPGQPTQLGTIAVPRGRPVSGRVVDEAGAPISGAQVLAGAVRRGVGNLNLNDPWDLVSDSDGRFTVAGLRDDSRYLLVAIHPRGCSRGVEVSPASDDGGVVTLVASPCGSLAGTVVHGGRPVPHVLVAIGDGCGSIGTVLDGRNLDHLTSLSRGRSRGSGLGTSPSA